MNIVYTAMDKDLTEDMIDHSERFYKLMMLYIHKLSLLPSKIICRVKSLQYKIIIITLVVGIITTLVLLWLIYKIKNTIEEETEIERNFHFIS